MGKSKPKRSKGILQQQPLKWTTEETYTLLAWADQCFKLELNFKDTVVQQLKQKWPERDFKYDPVEGKLKRVWARLGKYGTQWRDIMSRGTQCLDFSLLDGDEEKAFNDAKSEFLENRRQLRSRTISIANSPRTEPFQSSAQTLSITASPMVELGGNVAHLQAERGGGCGRRLQLAKRVRSLQLANSPSIKKSRSSSGRSTQHRIKISDSDDSDVQLNDEITIQSSPCLQQTLKGSASDMDVDNRHSLSSEDSDSFENFVNVLEEKDLNISHAKARISTLQESIAERDSSISVLREQNETLLKSNERLSNQVSRLSREIEDFQTRLSDRDDCWRAAIKHPETKLAETIMENEVTITYLKSRLQECEEMAMVERSAHISSREIGETIGHIEDRVKAWSYRSNIIFRNSLINFDLGPRTEDFLRQSLASLLETAPIEGQIIEVAKDVGDRNLVRALTAAVLHKWIFESDFHNFDEQESELLAMYRKKLFRQRGGPRFLRNLDFSAQGSLFMGKYFREHTFVSKSEELVAKFLELLAPFFPRATTDGLTDGTAIWAENSEDMVMLCKDLFQKALQLKIDLMLNTDQYNMRTFEPGTIFNPATMIAKTREGAEIKDLGRKSLRRVKLCLFPALYSYPAEALPIEDQADAEGFDLSRLVVQYRNFLHPGDYHGQKGTIVSKAVVLLENGGQLHHVN